MKNSDFSTEDILRLISAAKKGGSSQQEQSDILVKTLMDKMTPDQSRQFSQILGDKQAVETILSSEQARAILKQLKKR